MNEDKKMYTISIESAETLGAFPAGTVFTIELSTEKLGIVRKVSQAYKDAWLSVHYDPTISICDVEPCKSEKIPCFSNNECKKCLLFKWLGGSANE